MEERFLRIVFSQKANGFDDKVVFKEWRNFKNYVSINHVGDDTSAVWKSVLLYKRDQYQNLVVTVDSYLKKQRKLLADEPPAKKPLLQEQGASSIAVRVESSSDSDADPFEISSESDRSSSDEEV